MFLNVGTFVVCHGRVYANNSVRISLIEVSLKCTYPIIYQIQPVTTNVLFLFKVKTISSVYIVRGTALL